MSYLSGNSMLSRGMHKCQQLLADPSGSTGHYSQSDVLKTP